MSNENCELKCGLNADKTTFEMALTSADGQILGAQMNALQLAEFVKVVGIARANMAPPVPAAPEGEMVTTAMDARAMLVEDGKRTLYLRHPAFGWFAWSMEPVQAKLIGYWLVNDAPAETETAPA
ncbi:MAG: hypothetical protein ABIO37_12490 [Caulobacteraceae bacterium]